MPTSGSTSTPKVIDISYRGLVGNGVAFTRRLGLGPENRFYNVLPMTYLGGFYNLLLIPILAEGSLVLDGAFGVPNLYGFWENVKTFGRSTPCGLPPPCSRCCSRWRRTRMFPTCKNRSASPCAAWRRCRRR